jgi:hypothetical protein
MRDKKTLVAFWGAWRITFGYLLYCPATCFAFASGLANSPAFTPYTSGVPDKVCDFVGCSYTLHPKKIALQGDFSCSIQNISLPLQPQTQIGLCRHIIKRRLLALVLEIRKLENFSHPKQDCDKCSLVCYIRCVPQRLAYQRGHSLFILVCKVFPVPLI